MAAAVLYNALGQVMLSGTSVRVGAASDPCCCVCLLCQDDTYYLAFCCVAIDGVITLSDDSTANVTFTFSVDAGFFISTTFDYFTAVPLGVHTYRNVLICGGGADGVQWQVILQRYDPDTDSWILVGEPVTGNWPDVFVNTCCPYVGLYGEPKPFVMKYFEVLPCDDGGI